MGRAGPRPPGQGDLRTIRLHNSVIKNLNVSKTPIDTMKGQRRRRADRPARPTSSVPRRCLIAVITSITLDGGSSRPMSADAV